MSTLTSNTFPARNQTEETSNNSVALNSVSQLKSLPSSDFLALSSEKSKTMPMNEEDLKQVGSLFNDTLPPHISNPIIEFYKKSGFDVNQIFGNPANGFKVLEQMTTAFPVFDATNSGTMLEQKTAFMSVGVKGAEFLINTKSAVFRRVDNMYKSGLLNDQEYRLALAEYETDIRRIRTFIDLVSIDLTQTMQDNREAQQTTDINRFKSLLTGLKNKTNDAFTLQQKNWNTLIVNSKTLGQNVKNNVLDTDIKLRSIYNNSNTTFNDAVISVYKPTAQNPSPEKDNKGRVRIPMVINGGEVELSDAKRDALLDAINPIGNGKSPVSIPNDVKPGSLTPKQAQGASAAEIRNMPSALARLNALNLDDAAIMAKFGVPRKVLQLEMEQWEKWKQNPGAIEALRPPNNKQPSSIDIDKEFIKTKLAVEKDTQLPLEFREKIKRMNQETFNGVVLTMSGQLINNIPKVAGTAGASMGPLGAVGTWAAAKGGVAMFKAITAEFGAANVDLQQLPNIIGQVARGENLTLSVKGMYLAVFNSITAHESLDLSIKARRISSAYNSNSLNSAGYTYTALQQSIIRLQQQYRGPYQASFQSLDNSKFMTNLQAENIKVDKQIALNNIEIAKGNNKNAIAAYSISLGAENKLIFDNNLTMVTSAMVKYNAAQAKFMLEHSFRDKLVKTSEGLIVSHLFIFKASQEIKKQLPKLEGEKLSLSDPKVLKLAATMTRNDFLNLNQNSDVKNILSDNGGKNVIAQAAISIVRDGSFAFAKQNAPFKEQSDEAVIANIKTMPDAYIAWSIDGKTNAPKSIPVTPQNASPMAPNTPKAVAPKKTIQPPSSVTQVTPAPNKTTPKVIDKGNLYFSKTSLNQHNAQLNENLISNRVYREYFDKVVLSGYKEKYLLADLQKLPLKQIFIKFTELRTIVDILPATSTGNAKQIRDAAIERLSALNKAPNFENFLKSINGTVNAFYGR